MSRPIKKNKFFTGQYGFFVIWKLKHCQSQSTKFMTERPLLQVKHLKTFFSTDEGLVKAVNDVNFTVRRGETIGIVGESGSGKSVTSLSIMRLVPQPPGEIVGGEIWYHPADGQPINLLDLPEKEMRKYRGNEISMIFQEPMTSLNPVFRCGEQVTEALMLHEQMNKAQAKARTLELFTKVQLPDPERIFQSYPHQLSGGQKQRVMIAMALSCNPGLLIADEPTTALDVTVQKSILDLMQGLKAEYNAAVLFITHDLGVIAEIADRVLVMYKGKIVEEGRVYDIFSNPQHPYTKGLLACRPPLDYRLKRLPVIADFMTVERSGEEWLLKEKVGSVKEVVEANKILGSEREERQRRLYAAEPLIKVEQLSTWFPGQRNFFGKPITWVKAVNEVSFDVYPGETLGLVGESGCGKTTLGRSLLRLTEARSGKVIYDGQDLLQLKPRALKQLRPQMQIIFQDPYSSLNPRMTVGQAIMEPMQVHGLYNNDEQRKQKVIDLLETVSMEAKHFYRYPHEFSGGQRQRICIARALALNPRFLVCDESVSALDVSVQAQVLNLLIDLREQFQLTYIFISHDLSVVKFISDRMIVMNGGQIEEYGDADDIYLRPQKAYTRKLIQAIPKASFKRPSKR
ncbi:MAG: ABC transporter ATP-binding protein [Bacteroidota bacterium]